MRRSLLLIVSVAAASLAARAQPAVPAGAVGADDIFAPGARLRISVPSVSREQIVGRVVSQDGRSLVFDTVDPGTERRRFLPRNVAVDEVRRVSLPLGSIQLAQVSVGRSRARAALKTGIVAALVGGTFLGLNYMATDSIIRMRGFVEGFRTGALVSAAVALPIGFGAGREKWRTVLGAERQHRREGPSAR